MHSNYLYKTVFPVVKNIDSVKREYISLGLYYSMIGWY